MSRPKGMTTREWLRSGWPQDAFFSFDYGGLNDDCLYWYFKRADRTMIGEAFEMLKNGGAMRDFEIVEHQQPFTINAISHGFRVYPKEVDFAFASMDSINSMLIYFFKQNGGVDLTYLPLHKLLNLKPHW